MSKLSIQFIWEEERTRKLFKISLLTYIGGSLVASIYGLFLPPSTPYHFLIIFVPLVDVLVGLANLIAINSKGVGWRFLLTNLIVQTAASIFMAITGGFSSPLQYASYALLIITLVQLGSEAASIMGAWAVLTFIGILGWLLKTGNSYSSILDFFVYTAPYVLFVVIARNLGKELSVQFEARQRLEEVDDLKNQFISLSSHYLRTPLTNLKGSISLLEKTSLDPKQRESFDRIGVSIKSLESLVEEMLSIAEIEKGKQKIAPVVSNMDIVIRNAVADFQVLAGSKGITLVYLQPREVVADFKFDPIKIRTVLFNLLDNAIKFNKPQGRVEVSLFKEENSCVIRVSDTGVGMSEQQRKTLFSSFNKGGMQEVFSMAHPGAGLSLYLTKLIVEAHGGVIEVDSVKDQGTTFTVKLPINS